MWSLFDHHLFLISNFFGASGVLCFMFVAFPGIFNYTLCLYCPQTKFLSYEESQRNRGNVISLRKHAYSNILKIL